MLFSHKIIQILDIIPHKGTIVPYSSRYVRFVFRAAEPMRVKAVALCEVLQGPTEIVNVSANADTVRYCVDRQVIDFDQQVGDLSILISNAQFLLS